MAVLAAAFLLLDGVSRRELPVYMGLRPRGT
jgi:hypothetical protein